MSAAVRFTIAALALVVSVVVGVQVSGATFTGTSTTQVAVNALNDWAPPTVSVTNPGASVSGTPTIQVSAVDSPGSGVASVKLQYSVADQGTWIDLCTDTSAPYSCPWNTTGLADGRYDLRAIATDNIGQSATSAIVSTKVSNNFAVVMTDLPTAIKGSVSLNAVLTNAGTTKASYFYFEYAPAGTTTWTQVPGCTKQTSAGSFTDRTCTWATPSVEASYDVRAVAIIGSGAGTTYTDVQTDVIVDNKLPTGALTVPAGTLQGVVNLAATADDFSDEGSGVDTVNFQYRPAGGTWASCGLSDTEPYGCALDTTSLANGSYEFRIVVADVVGNTFTSGTVTRTVDNTAPTTSITSPAAGATVKGNAVNVTAAAASVLGITSVRIDVSTDGTNWLPLCTDTTAPYSCTWDTTAITGSQTMYLRSVATQTGGAFITSATVNVTVDNTPLRGADVQAQNVGTLQWANSGDRLILTYSTLVDLTTIKAGWNGSATSLTATLSDKNILTGRLVGAYDRFDFTGANLGQIGIAQNQVKASKQVIFNNSSMVASTTTVNGQQATVITVTLGTPNNSGSLRSSTVIGSMRWIPSALARTPQGVASSTAMVMESGAADKDL